MEEPRVNLKKNKYERREMDYKRATYWLCKVLSLLTY